MKFGIGAILLLVIFNGINSREDYLYCNDEKTCQIEFEGFLEKKVAVFSSNPTSYHFFMDLLCQGGECLLKIRI